MPELSRCEWHLHLTSLGESASPLNPSEEEEACQSRVEFEAHGWWSSPSDDGTKNVSSEKMVLQSNKEE
ncbi:unnamed protein product [Musa acuminata var. zebrina]